MSASHPLRKFRESHKPRPLSQQELARALGVTKATISRWETRERFPEREFWPRIKAVTGLGLDDLVEAAA